MSAEQVALIPSALSAASCGCPQTQTGWQAYLPDDEPPELAFYCPTCAEREFESK